MIVKVIKNLVSKSERGKVFQRIVNVVCSTFMHCLYKVDIMISEKRNREHMHSINSHTDE